MKKIESVQNSYIKFILQLQEKSKARKQNQLFVIEGKREIELAFKGNFEIETLLFCTNLFSENNFSQYNVNSIIEISKEVYQKIAYRDSTEGIIAIAKTKENTLENLKLSKNPLILIAESPEKPGNIGAMLRTADAANIDAILITNPKSDIYNPNIVRSSVGCLFTKQIAICTNDQAIAFLKHNKIQFYAATLQNSTAYYTQNYKLPTAFVVGPEAEGLSEIWRTEATQNIIIPMQGEIDSMNVSVAAAILLFEAKKQRNFN